MRYFQVQDGKLVAAADSLTTDQHQDRSWKCSWDIKDFAMAESLAEQATEMFGEKFVGADRGAHVAPRYEFTRVPKVGDKVSYSFNGDTYPDGEIVTITNKYQVTTSTGHKYRRKGLTAAWLRTGGTWCLVEGHHYEQNPHF